MKELSLERLKEVALYDPLDGSFTRRSPMGRHGCHQAGQKMGRVGLNGYIHISIDCQIYYGHRLAWLYMTGKWPIAQVDHIDRNRANNIFDNLREATNAQNQWNRKCLRTDGRKGIYLHKLSGLWTARIKVNGISHSLGYFKSPDDAHAAYVSASKIHHGEFSRAK